MRVAVLVLFLGLGCKENAPPAVEKGPSQKKAEVEEGRRTPKKSDDVKSDTGDLDRIKTRGTLRIVIQGDDEQDFLPRSGMPALQDIQQAEAFAEEIGVTGQLILVDRYEDLIPMLLDGRADLIAAQFTVTEERKKKVAFGRSTASIDEILVGRKGAPDLPRKLEELNGREVHVRKSASYWETLKELKKEKLPDLKLVAVEEHLDAESIVHEVTVGKRPLTVVDSHILDAIETYNENVERLFPVAEDRELAWAVRKDNPDLRAAVDAFVIEQAMKGVETLRTGDLDEIKERGVIRVITRNNPITYFLHKGRQFGFDYELMKIAARDLDVRLEMVVPPSRDLLIPWLLEGRGDVVAASLTVNEGRKAKVAFSHPYFYVDELVVKKKGAKGPSTLEEMKGRTIHVRKSSSYYATLKKKQKVGGFEIALAPEDLETEDLIAQVASGEIELTVADSNILDLELTYGTEVEEAFPLTQLVRKEGEKRSKLAPDAAKSIAFAVRKDNPKLRSFLSKWAEEHYRGLHYNILKKRYFASRKNFAKAKEHRLGKTGKISPYDDLIQRFAAKYGLDWRLMAAQAFVESRFDPNAKSWVGAQGLFQVMPRTGEALGFDNLQDPEEGVHAGIKYMDRLIERFDPEIPFKQRVLFALASYNAGYGHVLDARRLAEAQGLDRNRWFGNVEKGMRLLAKPEFARHARHGYCRGGEPVAYVAHIEELYDAYVKVTAD